MQIEVRDKSFDITFVNNWSREKYQELLEYIDELSDLPGKFDDIDKSEKDRKEKLNTLQHELVRKITDLRFEIIVELLETNNYEYDDKWWKRKTDVEDLNNFMLTCMQKDLKKS